MLGVASIPMTPLMEQMMFDTYTSVFGAPSRGRCEKVSFRAAHSVRLFCILSQSCVKLNSELIRIMRWFLQDVGVRFVFILYFCDWVFAL